MEMPEAIDASPHACIGFDNPLAQRLSFDEVFGKLVERTMQTMMLPRPISCLSNAATRC
jgi:hypothetical protein